MCQLRAIEKKLPMLLACLAVWGLAVSTCVAQRARFDDFFQVQNQSGGIPPFNSLQPPPGSMGPANGGGVVLGQPPLGFSNPMPNMSGPAVIQTPSFDPFQMNSNPFPIAPGGAVTGNPPLWNQTQPWNQPPQGWQQPPPSLSFSDSWQQPPVLQTNPPQGNWGSPWGNPNSGNWPNSAGAWPSQAWSQLRNEFLPRLLERPRFRQTYVHGRDPDELSILDTELATTLNYPNFLGGTQPLQISPGFIFHFWDGPNTAITGFDLPAQAYSPYLSFDFTSDRRRPAGIETNFTAGFYSDFSNTSTDALRFTGVGLGWVRVNPYTTFKAGVEYFDRIDVKMLPAVGFFLQPNNDLKIDLYFPRPKFAHRLPKANQFDVWGYVAGEYGGGSWAIERIFGADDQVDINDVRAMVGLEWLGPRNVTGFLEGGYVFEREMLYRSNPNLRLSIPDSLMLRLGIAF